MSEPDPPKRQKLLNKPNQIVANRAAEQSNEADDESEKKEKGKEKEKEKEGTRRRSRQSKKGKKVRDSWEARTDEQTDLPTDLRARKVKGKYAVLKLEFAGSGDDLWRWGDPDAKTTQIKQLKKEEVRKTLKGWSRFTRSFKPAPVIHVREKKDRKIYTIGGPNVAGGIPDIGRNQIANNIKYAQGLIRNFVNEHEGDDVLVLIKAHSRGAVAASMVSAWVKSLDFKKNVTKKEVRVETVLFDPVPGPNHPQYEKVDLSDVDESTVVYSFSPKGAGARALFAPQFVSGTKRIIWSKRPHDVGLKKGIKSGVMFREATYRYSGLNDLPHGEYLSENVDDKKRIDPIELLTRSELKEKISLSPQWFIRHDMPEMAETAERKVIVKSTRRWGLVDWLREAPQLGATISVPWGGAWHSIALNRSDWAKVKAGKPLLIRGRGYSYEGEFFQDRWDFGGGLDGELTVWNGEDRGQGFVGDLKDAEILEYEWQGAANARLPYG